MQKTTVINKTKYMLNYASKYRAKIISNAVNIQKYYKNITNH